MHIPRTEGLIIQGNEVLIDTYSKEGKHGFVISRREDGNYEPLIKSGADYATIEEATKSGNDLVAEIRKIDLEF
jgi:hypothetical protein